MDRIYETKALSAEAKLSHAEALERLELLLTHHWDELVRTRGASARYEHLSHAVAVSTSPAGTSDAKVARGWTSFHASALIQYSYDSPAAHAEARHKAGRYRLAELRTDAAIPASISVAHDRFKEAP